MKHQRCVKWNPTSILFYLCFGSFVLFCFNISDIFPKTAQSSKAPSQYYLWLLQLLMSGERDELRVSVHFINILLSRSLTTFCSCSAYLRNKWWSCRITVGFWGTCPCKVSMTLRHKSGVCFFSLLNVFIHFFSFKIKQFLFCFFFFTFCHSHILCIYYRYTCMHSFFENG